MRTYEYSPLCIQILAEMGATEAEFRAINQEVAQLARKPRLGYPVPFLQSSTPSWRYDVGRFGLIYTFDADKLKVVTVVG